jgi:hypothetical protein
MIESRRQSWRAPSAVGYSGSTSRESGSDAMQVDALVGACAAALSRCCAQGLSGRDALLRRPTVGYTRLPTPLPLLPAFRWRTPPAACCRTTPP